MTKNKLFTLILLANTFLSINLLYAGCSFEEASGTLTCGGATYVQSSDITALNINKTEVKKVIIEEGVTQIRNFTFKSMSNLTSVILPAGLKTIAWGAFQSTGLQSVVIPESVEAIEGEAFRYTHVSAFIEGTPTIQNYAFENAYDPNPNAIKLYCSDGGTDCGCDHCVSPTAYSLEDGLYIIGEGQDAKYFASKDLMLADRNGNKACKDKNECMEILAKSEVGKSFIAGGRFYNSLENWAKGIYEKKRIFTVQEANEVSAPTGNRVSIRYK